MLLHWLSLVGLAQKDVPFHWDVAFRNLVCSISFFSVVTNLALLSTSLPVHNPVCRAVQKKCSQSTLRIQFPCSICHKHILLSLGCALLLDDCQKSLNADESFFQHCRESHLVHQFSAGIEHNVLCISPFYPLFTKNKKEINMWLPNY